MWKYGSKTIREHKSWTDDNGVTHPKNWHIWSPSEKAAAGLTEVTPETPPDSRLYTWGYQADGVTISKTAKPLDDINEVDENGDPLLDDDGVQMVTKGVKSNLIGEVRTQQGSLLSQTDWALVRFVDTAVAVPANIQTWRDAIRAKATEMETAITNAADTDAIAALFLTYTLEDDGSTTKSGILYDWPEFEN
jgi:hypothetical protein